MRRTRFMSLLFLVLSAAFFFVPAFRQPFDLMWSVVGLNRGRLPGPSSAELQRWTQEAESSRDAQALAYLATQVPDRAEGARLAGKAVQLDPSLRWIYFGVIGRDHANPAAGEWARKVQALAPDNALGYLLEAETLAMKSNARWQNPEEAAANAPWRALMDKAFSVPTYNSYAVERFELGRDFMRGHGEATPARVLLYLAQTPIPNLLNIRQYDELLLKLGKEAEAAGKLPEAAAYYWKAAHFGERMEVNSTLLIEQLIATTVRRGAYEGLVPLLRKQGNTEAAATLQYAVANLAIRDNAFRGKDPLSQTSTYIWISFMVAMFVLQIWLFSILTFLAVLYVNLKAWIRPEHRGRLFTAVTIAENYLPILLFASCAGLYLSYYPYSVNFEHYMTATGPMHDFESFFYNTVPYPGILIQRLSLPVGNPFVPYVWYALGGLALALALMAVAGMRQDKTAQ